MLRLASLGSGSRGNATLVRSDSTTLLIDCGFGIRETLARLKALQVEPEEIDVCLVTHEHGDHLAGVAALVNRYNIKVCMTAGTKRSWSKAHDLMDIQVMELNTPFSVNEIEVTPIPVPHDAREPVQFTFRLGEVKLGILTDLGMITPVVRSAYSDCTALLIEANHDLDMLMEGNYPPTLKRRVSGNWGHLNNRQTADFVREITQTPILRELVIGHISQQNNHLDLVAKEIEPVARGVRTLHYASQDSPMTWIQLS